MDYILDTTPLNTHCTWHAFFHQLARDIYLYYDTKAVPFCLGRCNVLIINCCFIGGGDSLPSPPLVLTGHGCLFGYTYSRGQK